MSATLDATHSIRPRYIPGYAIRDDVSAESRRKGFADVEGWGNVSVLQNAGTTLKVERGKTIFRDGDLAEFSYRVIGGAVRLCKLFPDGRRQIVDFCLPGDFFGFGSPDEYALTAEAVSDATVIRYSRKHIEHLGRVSPDFRDHLMALLHRGLSSAQNHLFMLGRQTVKERVTSFLLMMLDRQGRAGENGDRLDLPMGRQDIADYLGLTIETVCRALSDLKRNGAIKAPGTREIVVTNATLLRATAEGDA
ncbi:helix-turn-helix domain-containing protein [Parvibaculum sp.]|uniref:helix-turn-helix domain-containing protein n=1 Tax=Parvibaculum sp. TaxID=2024848 RepID=UPI002730C133|nr:helix-turn-helix domain-containing protein [Parvibaculum sp.]MDP1627407.1 helix-turn-helix domain-containing protein [Parvibaculum sp.]MDP2148586.1 helix-turn-helix domain-containing protein [Parvibaculum sp.]MDP3327543.1 helix-turn-helix domain-containing protein [Parvibaculum sp.]